jgi:hypothetical protein
MILDSIVFLVFIVFFWERIKSEIKELLNWSSGFKSYQVDQRGLRFSTKYEKTTKKHKKTDPYLYIIINRVLYFYIYSFIFYLKRFY